MQLDTIEGFRKVLNSLNKEDLEDILANSYIPSSGKKEKVVLRLSILSE